MVTQWQQLFYEDRFVSHQLIFSNQLGYVVCEPCYEVRNANITLIVGPYPPEGTLVTSLLPLQQYQLSITSRPTLPCMETSCCGTVVDIKAICICLLSGADMHIQNPDFVKLSEAMGVQAQRCISPDEVEAKLKWLIESEGPALLEVQTDQKVDRGLDEVKTVN